MFAAESGGAMCSEADQRGAAKQHSPNPYPVADDRAAVERAVELLRDAQYHLRADGWAEEFNGRVNDFLAAIRAPSTAVDGKDGALAASGTGPLGLRPESASSLGHAASVPSAKGEE
jgi:hypothetical protein